MSLHRLGIRDTTLTVLDEGQGDVLLFVHGFPLNRTMWSAQVEAFAPDYRVLVPDLRGHGQSTVTPGIVTMEAMSADLEAMLERLDVDRPITFCGLSMGGYVAWEFWRRAPGRLARLILCDTRAADDPPEVARGREMMAAQVVASGVRDVADSMPPKLFAPSTLTEQPKQVEAVRQMMLTTDPEGLAATQRGMAQRRNVTDMLGEMDVPTLLICGSEDTISPPREMQDMAQRMPRAQFVEIARAGHLAPVEQPVATNQAIRDFLANT